MRLIKNKLLQANLNTYQLFAFSPGFCQNFLPFQSGLVIPELIEMTKRVQPYTWHIICLWYRNALQSGVTVMCLDTAGYRSSLWPGQSDFSPPHSPPFHSFILAAPGSYYSSWNDFSRDAAIPRELSLPAAIQSIPNWTGLWFIENLLWRSSSSTHIHAGNQQSVILLITCIEKREMMNAVIKLNKPDLFSEK